MIVNRYQMLEAGIPTNKIANFTATLSRLYPPDFKTMHIETPVKRGSHTYTTIRNIAHYDTEYIKALLELRIIEPSNAKEVHRKAWRKLISSIEMIEVYHANHQ